MLQWMGGSRRKVNSSRKSTLNRQKQYFEQRRWQQQYQQQANGIESYGYGTSTAGKNDKEYQSLDILSLLNLSKVSQEQKSACPDGRENIEVNASRAKYDLSENPQTSASKTVPTSVKLNKGKTGSGFVMEVASPNKVISTAPDNHRRPVNEMYSKPHNSRTPAEQVSESCVLDFFANDGSEDDYVEGSPVREAHVACSVEGLGKVEMETPPHSPKQPGRISYNCSSPLQGARKVNSFKNLERLDDIQIEMDTVMQDVSMPLSSNELDFSVDLMHSFSNPKNKVSTFSNCTQYGGHGSKFETCYGGSRIFDDIGNSSKDRWGGKSRSNFLEENSFNEWEHDLSLKRPSDVRHISIDNMMHGEYGMSDFTFEEPFSPTRFCSTITDKFDTLESPSYLKHQVLENDLDFMISNGQRQHTGGRKSHFQGVATRRDWSCFVTECDKDNASLLSEESCSSSAVRVNATDDLPKSSRKHNKRRHGNSYIDPEYLVDMTPFSRTQDRSKDCFQPENIAHGSGRCTNLSKSLKFKPSNHSNTTFQEKTTPNSNWWNEERYMSVDINSGSSSFHQHSCQSAGSNIVRRSTKWDLFPRSHDRAPSPDLSAQESFSKAEEGKAKFQPNEKFRQEEQNAILKNLFTKTEDAASASLSKNKNSECKKAKDADSGLNEESIKTAYIPDHTVVVEEESNHSEIPLPSRSWNKVDTEMEESEPLGRKKESRKQNDFANSPSQVMMLQSYVLQFLCVQQVLKDATAHNSMKKT